MGVLIWRGLVTPKFSVPLAAKLCVRPPNVLEVQERALGPLSPYQVWCGSDFTRCWVGEKTLSFLSVRHAFFFRHALSLHHAYERQSLFARFRHEDVGEEMIFMLLDRGRFVVVHPCSTFSDCRQLSTSLNAEIQKTAKIGVFRRQRAIE